MKDLPSRIVGVALKRFVERSNELIPKRAPGMKHARTFLGLGDHDRARQWVTARRPDPEERSDHDTSNGHEDVRSNFAGDRGQPRRPLCSGGREGTKRGGKAGRDRAAIDDANRDRNTTCGESKGGHPSAPGREATSSDGGSPPRLGRNCRGGHDS